MIEEETSQLDQGDMDSKEDAASIKSVVIEEKPINRKSQRTNQRRSKYNEDILLDD